MGIDDVADRPVRNGAERGYGLGSELSQSRIHEQNSILARLYGDVPTVADQHGDAALHREDVDFRIGRSFTFAERYKFSILGEAFNLFNFTNIYSVHNTEYNYAAAGSGACGGHTNNCVVQNTSPTGFGAPTATNTNLTGARQLQIAARFTF